MFLSLLWPMSVEPRLSVMLHKLTSHFVLDVTFRALILCWTPIADPALMNPFSPHDVSAFVLCDPCVQNGCGSQWLRVSMAMEMHLGWQLSRTQHRHLLSIASSLDSSFCHISFVNALTMSRTKGDDPQDDVAKQLFTDLLAVGNLSRRNCSSPYLSGHDTRFYSRTSSMSIRSVFRKQVVFSRRMQAGPPTRKSNGRSQVRSLQLMGCLGCSQRCWRGSPLRRDRLTVTRALARLWTNCTWVTLSLIWCCQRRVRLTERVRPAASSQTGLIPMIPMPCPRPSPPFPRWSLRRSIPWPQCLRRANCADVQLAKRRAAMWSRFRIAILSKSWRFTRRNYLTNFHHLGFKLLLRPRCP